MTDTVSKEKRSAMMSKIGGKNTLPELKVRSVLHRMGFRFRLHVADLPGKPDIVLPKYKTVVFVHGCFWHRHIGCKSTTNPGTRTDFWNRKFEANVRRDGVVHTELQNLGWNVIIVWQCELSDLEAVARRLKISLLEINGQQDAEPDEFVSRQ